jgi:Fe2+ transport system protein FeoA
MYKNYEYITERLTECPEGTTVRIKEISAGRGAVINLMNLGLNVDNVITISRKSSFKGPVLVTFRDSEIAIGNNLAQKIIVERI